MPDALAGVFSKLAVFASKKLTAQGLLKNGSKELIELNFMSNEQIAKINKQLRGKNCPTDVISLRLANSMDSLPKEVFGEIYISLEKCKDQAEEIDQSFLEELAFLTVHGILHIFGYDHKTPEEEKLMMGVANDILKRR